jgi:hypothetical protein
MYIVTGPLGICVFSDLEPELKSPIVAYLSDAAVCEWLKKGWLEAEDWLRAGGAGGHYSCLRGGGAAPHRTSAAAVAAVLERCISCTGSAWDERALHQAGARRRSGLCLRAEAGV